MKTLLILTLILIPMKKKDVLKSLALEKKLTVDEVREFAFSVTLSEEGGVSDVDEDKGGYTNKGITYTTYKAFCSEKGKAEDKEEFKEMPKELWDQIALEYYWNKINLDSVAQIDPEAACFMFDFSFNSGYQVAGMYLQKALNKLGAQLKVDGKVGPLTLQEITYRKNILFYELLNQRKTLYSRLANSQGQKKFLAGWYSRLLDITLKIKTWKKD